MEIAGPGFAVDTSVYTRANRKYYAHDFCPAFWECSLELHRRRTLVSIRQVLQEIEGGPPRDLLGSEPDFFFKWATGHADDLFVMELGPDVEVAQRAVMDLVRSKDQYDPRAIAKFDRAADSWVIAYSMVHGTAVVSEEKSAPAAIRRVPIPDICDSFGVRHLETHVMLREVEAKFEGFSISARVF